MAGRSGNRHPVGSYPEGLIAFAESEAGVKVFGGEDAARKVAAHGREIQAAGGKYCDCPACAAVEAILAKKDDIL